MDESNENNEYQKIFTLDKDLTIRVMLNKPVRDLTLVIGKIVRIQATGETIVHETGFLEKKRKKIVRKFLFTNFFKRINPFQKKKNKNTNQTK